MLSDQTRDGLFVSCLLYVCDVCGQCACDVCVVENAHAMLLLIENGSKAVRVDFKLEIQGQQIPLLFLYRDTKTMLNRNMDQTQ